MTASNDLRAAIRRATLEPEANAVQRLIASASLDEATRQRITDRAVAMVRDLRENQEPGLMEQFLGEYGLSTKEGVALMCLAEALLRVPDAETIDALIQDKIVPADWGKHLGHSASSLVNASTWALMLTGRVLKEDVDTGITSALHDMVRRLGEPVVRKAVSQAMREMGQQFVLGEDITAAMKRAAGMEAKGFTYSYDMLGEAARTEADARRYHLAYADAIGDIAKGCKHDDIRQNPGISVKLSALNCRYEYGQRDRVVPEITARLSSLLTLAKSANMGLNIDAEEADRLDLSLDIIEAALSNPALEGWDGFGVVVQAYGPRAAHVLDWLNDLATRLDRRIMVRLVKGAYWDAEIKRSQVMGLDGFPVFTRKVNTDVSYISCAKKLLGMTDRIYPQFATHNAHTVAAILELANDPKSFEFQRLHGMGESLHTAVLRTNKTQCRIYAPVGAHEDLLAYLVRRLLENGANSSFVNQIVDETVPPETVAADPIAAVQALGATISHAHITHPSALFGSARKNAKGWDLTDPVTVDDLNQARDVFRTHHWKAAPIVGFDRAHSDAGREVTNPADTFDRVGMVYDATAADVERAFEAATVAYPDWAASLASHRAACLRRVADAYEDNAPELMALACREAGKTLLDGVAEIREAVDFLRFYASEAERLESLEPANPLGTFVCISPWNFPLAIFTGQISAALAAGNAVIAKPAEQTCLIAARAVELMIESGIPCGVIQLLPGDGLAVGAPLVSSPHLAGVCFTGSTETAHAINRAMADHADPTAPLIAETGGLNAMIVDSSALPEQAVRDAVMSAFQSAGQRCSAARIVYVQKDVEHRTLTMLKGAMAALRIGNPWNISTDVGPVIDEEAQNGLQAYIDDQDAKGHVIARLAVPDALRAGRFVTPTVVRVDGIEAMEREIFGPVLHIATFEPEDLNAVVDAINARGYGLTLGIHTRVDQRVQDIVERAHVGNIYVNRNQIGAVVGSQPFGGEGLSGTGPKAGGPLYLRRFRKPKPGVRPDVALNETDLPGPTGESNRHRVHPRGDVWCFGTDVQREAVEALGNTVHVMDRNDFDVSSLETISNVDAVMAMGTEDALRSIRQALAARPGPIVPLVLDPSDVCGLVTERALCIDTTAAGGNASLLAAAAE